MNQHNLVRKGRLASGKAQEHNGEVALVENEDFDLEATIFRTVDSPLARASIHARLKMEPYWKESAAKAIEKAYDKIPRSPAQDVSLIQFMDEECNFAMEHADGSFMDHLLFCSEYTSIHYAQVSPRVLFLHSILGVGTNYFPCTADKIPKLEALLTPFEMVHVEAFPSILRLILRQSLMTKLEAMSADELNSISGIDFFRVIDNKAISLNSHDDFWSHLNYQLIHLLDFLPLLDWNVAAQKDIFLVNFIQLYKILLKANQLRVHLDYDLNQFGSKKGTASSSSLSLGFLITNYVPAPLQMAIGRRQVANFSRQIGHSLDFTLRTSPSPAVSS